MVGIGLVVGGTVFVVTTVVAGFVVVIGAAVVVGFCVVAVGAVGSFRVRV